MNDSAANDDVFFLHHVYGAIFSTHLCWWFEGAGKIKLIKIHFFFEFHSPCGMWTPLYRILPVLLPTFTHMHVTSILHGQVIHFSQKLQRSCVDSRICFNAICLFCGIVRGYLRKKITTRSPRLSNELNVSDTILYNIILVWGTACMVPTTPQPFS